MKSTIQVLLSFAGWLIAVPGQPPAIRAQEFQSPKSGQFTLRGSIAGWNAQDGTQQLRLRYTNADGHQITDTIQVNQGTFIESGQIPGPEYVTLLGKDTIIDLMTANVVSFFLEPGTIEIQLIENDYGHAKIKGSLTQTQYDSLQAVWHGIANQYADFNDRYLAARKAAVADRSDAAKQKTVDSLTKLKPPIQAEANKATYRFIKSHPDADLSASLAVSLSSFLSLDSSEQLLHGMTPSVQSSFMGGQFKIRLALIRANSVGHAPHPFHTLDYDGSQFALNTLSGKYVLIDFWASWCIPCIEGIPALKSFERQYHRKGLEILTISVDRDSLAWRKGVQKYALAPFHNVLANKEIWKYYRNARQPIPSQILLDPSGKIIWRSNDADKDLATILQANLK